MEDKDRFDALVLIVKDRPSGVDEEEFVRYLIDNASVVIDHLHILKTSPLYGVRTKGRRAVPAGPGIPTVPEPTPPDVTEAPTAEELAAGQDLETGEPLAQTAEEKRAARLAAAEAESTRLANEEAAELKAAEESRRKAAERNLPSRRGNR